MSAVLKVEPITASVVHKPQYNNSALKIFSQWYATNEPALGQYFLALETSEQERYEDFREFVLCQYDVECELLAAASRTTYGDGYTDEGRSWTEQMEYETGKPATGPL